jgi:hypothetical protein
VGTHYDLSTTGARNGSRSCLPTKVSPLLIVLCCLIAFGFSSCTEDGPIEVPPVTYHDSTIVVRIEGCKGLLEECGGVDVRFPVFNGGDSAAIAQINRRTLAFFVDLLGYGDVESEAIPNVFEAAHGLVADFNEFRNDYPNTSQVWVFQGIANTLVVDSLICTEAEAFSYLGGAHPNTSIRLSVARSADGSIVRVEDLAENEAVFLMSAEEAFREAVGMLEGDVDYAARGFWFDDNKFTLPANIGVSLDSVILHYNTYEIAPYAMGSVRCTLPRSILSNAL